MLSNAYFLAKFRFDTAENEPAKNLQNFRKIATYRLQNSNLSKFAIGDGMAGAASGEAQIDRG